MAHDPGLGSRVAPLGPGDVQYETVPHERTGMDRWRYPSGCGGRNVSDERERMKPSRLCRRGRIHM